MGITKEVWIGVVVTALVAAGFWYYRYGPTPPASPGPATAAQSEPASPAADESPAILHPAPAPEAPAAEPLPALPESDSPMREEVTGLFESDLMKAMLVSTRIIPNAVATLDSLDRAPVPLRIRALSHVQGVVLVDTSGDALMLSPANAARYRPLVGALEKVEGRAIANLYLRYYPLFQQAYEEQGYPGRYFNDRLVQIIDHLLAAPEIAGPIALTRPKVLYQYADPELEKRSSGHKLLIRIGPQNAAVVKSKLREIRAAIAVRSPEVQADRSNSAP